MFLKYVSCGTLSGRKPARRLRSPQREKRGATAARSPSCNRVVPNLHISVSQTMQTHQSVPHTQLPAECKLKALLTAPTSGYFKRVCRLKMKEQSLVETNSRLYHPSHPNWSCCESKWQAHLTWTGWDGTRGFCHLGARSRSEHPHLPSLRLAPRGGRDPKLSPTVWRAACPHPGADTAFKKFAYTLINRKTTKFWESHTMGRQA